MVKKDTLVIIGNGFDIWQNLDTSYKSFKKYYQEHRDEILAKLKIKKIKIKDENGKTQKISDVELIYGDPFDPGKLDDEFWHTFEASLDKIDAFKVNLYFGKSKKQLKQLKKTAQNARKILITAFCDWVNSIKIEKQDCKFHFKDNCYFVNFNYTETLEKCFGIDEDDICHIHGDAKDPESIIVGHCSHPQSPEIALKQLGGRFRGLYHIEEILFETDKHTEENIMAMSLDFSTRIINNYEIENIYVLGHSFGEADMSYFEFFKRATGDDKCQPKTTEFDDDEEFSEESFIAEIPLRMNYVIKRYGCDKSILEPILPEEEKAILKKCRFEQFVNSRIMEEDFFKTMKQVYEEEGIEIEDTNLASFTDFDDFMDKHKDIPQPPKRTKSAKWHISYYSEEDKKRIKHTMKTLGIKNYTLYDSIDKAIENLKK